MQKAITIFEISRNHVANAIMMRFYVITAWGAISFYDGIINTNKYIQTCELLHKEHASSYLATIKRMRSFDIG